MIKVIRNAVSKDLCAVQAWNMDLLNAAMGYPGDPTMDNAFGYYAPVFLEGMLLHMKDIVEREVQKPLHPTYSYGRIYYAESELTTHTDRPAVNGRLHVVSIKILIGKYILNSLVFKVLSWMLVTSAFSRVLNILTGEMFTLARDMCRQCSCMLNKMVYTIVML